MCSRIVELDPSNTAFFVCDIQEKFKPAISYFEEIVTVAEKLINTTKVLSIPLVVTTQYAKGLGPTVQKLDISNAVGVFDKTKFSMIVPEVEELLQTLCNGNLQAVILFGIEAHVCVEQTALDLLKRNIQVHVVADASSSRTQADRLFAFQRLQQLGAIISTSESVIFKLIKDKNHPSFNKIRELIKVASPDTNLVPKCVQPEPIPM